jgi:hypothetical protein
VSPSFPTPHPTRAAAYTLHRSPAVRAKGCAARQEFSDREIGSAHNDSRHECCSKVPKSCYLPNTANAVGREGGNAYLNSLIFGQSGFKSVWEVGLLSQQSRNRLYYTADLSLWARALDPSLLSFHG